MLKCLNCKVLHRKLRNDYGSYCDDKIIIDSRIKNSQLGVSVLAHEAMHFISEVEGRFPAWEGKMKFTKSNWNLVRRAEIQASKDGRQLLRALKAPPVYFRELDPSQRKKLEKLWRKEYFSD